MHNGGLLPLALAPLPLAFHGADAVLFGVGIFWFALTMTVVAIAIVTHRHRTVPGDMLPRVLAITHVFSWGGAPLGALVAGGLATALGVRMALVGVMAASLAVPASVWASGEMRRRIDLEGE